MKSLVRRRLVDRVVDAYVDWRDACVRVWDADQAWALARGRGASAAFSRSRQRSSKRRTPPSATPPSFDTLTTSSGLTAPARRRAQ